MNGIWVATAFWLVRLVPYGVVLPRVFGWAGIDAAGRRDGGGVRADPGVRVGVDMATRAVSQFFYGMHRASVVMVAGITANVITWG